MRPRASQETCSSETTRVSWPEARAATWGSSLWDLATWTMVSPWLRPTLRLVQKNASTEERTGLIGITYTKLVFKELRNKNLMLALLEEESLSLVHPCLFVS